MMVIGVSLMIFLVTLGTDLLLDSLNPIVHGGRSRLCITVARITLDVICMISFATFIIGALSYGVIMITD